jgi:predicted aldo/keto reductase-like oxidoreductase
MEHRMLGRTGVSVCVVGLGTEYLENTPEETVCEVVRTALDSGVNYIDMWMATPGVRNALGKALKGRRSEAFIAGHIGAVLVDGKTDRSRDATIAGRNFEDFLVRVGTDYVDAAMLFFVDEPEDFDRVFAPGGTADLAKRMKKEGKARFIGFSTHYAPTALRAVRSGLIDILMFPVNPAFDLIQPILRIEALWEADTYAKTATDGNSAVSLKRELYVECARQGVAIIAMKPFAAGWLFKKDNPSSITLTPVQCLHYALSQPGVAAAVPGCRSVEELRGCLAYLDADYEAREYGAIASNNLWKLQGKCMYCGHCLPCPIGIEVEVVTRLLDAAKSGMTAAIREKYLALGHGAGECTECGVCVERCPFGVDILANMREAYAVFT